MLNNQWTRAYKKATKQEAWFLEQRWDGRQFWYPTAGYVAWLEGRLKQMKKEISPSAPTKKLYAAKMLKQKG